MFKCEKCNMFYSNLDKEIVNAGTENEMIICRSCADSMLNNNEMDICVACGEYITYSIRDTSLEKWGCFDDFDECPCCGKDFIEGYSKIGLMKR